MGSIGIFHLYKDSFLVHRMLRSSPANWRAKCSWSGCHFQNLTTSISYGPKTCTSWCMRTLLTVSKNTNSLKIVKKTKTLQNKHFAFRWICNAIDIKNTFLILQDWKTNCQRFRKFQTKVDDCRAMQRVWWSMNTVV